MEAHTNTISTLGVIGLGYVGLPPRTHGPPIDLAAVVEHADIVVDLRNAVRHRLGDGVAGAVPANVDVL